MNHLKQQTFLVLEGSSEVARQKIKGDSHLKKKLIKLYPRNRERATK